MNLTDELRLLKQLLVDADQTAADMGSPYGLCDCIDNSGVPYPSQALADVLEGARSEGIRPARTMDEIRAAGAWRRALPMTQKLLRRLEGL